MIQTSEPITSTSVRAVVTTGNGGVYQIQYDRPGPVDDTEVRQDLADLGEQIATQIDMDVAITSDDTGVFPIVVENFADLHRLLECTGESEQRHGDDETRDDVLHAVAEWRRLRTL
jgi:hypothetical protein